MHPDACFAVLSHARAGCSIPHLWSAPLRSRSISGGRHELGQNFLTHTPTLQRLTSLVADTDGAILELGAGDGALTTRLARLPRPLRAIDIDEHRVTRLRSRLPRVDVRRSDALCEPLDRPVVVGNIPFHLTTPILRRLLSTGAWRHAILLTQWEVARKRAGVGGATMMTAQAAPWFVFRLHDRVPARHFRPMPSVDGGILAIERRDTALVHAHHRRRYEAFVAEAFRSRGNGMRRILHSMRYPPAVADRALAEAGVAYAALPRDLAPEQWATLWRRITTRRR